MKTQRRMLVAIICAFAVMASVIGVAAQETQERRSRVETQTFTFDARTPDVRTVGGQGDNTFVFVSSEMSIDGKLVTGAPYSAEAVTETIQTLADGNRIVRRNTATVYRDSEGRTRREQTINAVGAYAAAGEPQQTIFINDPVAEINYVLDAKNHIARKLALPGIKKKLMAETKAAGAREEADVTAELHAKATGEVKIQMGPNGAESGMIIARMDPKNTKKESLGKQTIEGVEAEGTRITTTIPAGEVGNEAAINIISERWYSPELQMVILSRNNDPRMGETTYRLSNINRTEPSRSLFEVPSDYTIKETVAPAMRYKIESEIKRPSTEKKDQ